jgi:hypothetical protein
VTKTSKQLKALFREEWSEGERLDSRNGMTKCNVQLKRITEAGMRKNNLVRSVEGERSVTIRQTLLLLPDTPLCEVHSATG